MMLSAATSTISVRIRNITLRSTSSAPKKVRLRCRQSVMQDRPARRLLDGGAGLVDPVGIVEIDLDQLHVVLAVEVVLRLGQRHEDEGGVELRHADLEDRLHRIALDARRGAEGRRGAARRDEREGVAGLQRQGFGEAPADGDALARSSKSSSVPCRMLPAMCSILRRSSGADAAHQHAAAVILRRAEGLPFHQRDGALDAGHGRDALAATSA